MRIEYRSESPEHRQAVLMRAKMERDGYYIDDDTEARVCAEGGCKTWCIAHGDDGTGERNRADLRCHAHGE